MIKLKKNNIIVASGESDAVVYDYIHKHESCSVSHAVEYNAYTVHEDDADITKNFILN